MAMRKTFSRGKTTILVNFEVPPPTHGWNMHPGGPISAVFKEISAIYKPYSQIQIKIQQYSDPEVCRKVVAYWYGEIIRKIREGLYDTGVCLNDAGTESWLRDRIDENASLSTAALRKFASAIQVDRETGQIREVIPVISNMDKAELRKLFDPIIAWSSENLHAAIIELDDFNW